MIFIKPEKLLIASYKTPEFKTIAKRQLQFSSIYNSALSWTPLVPKTTNIEWGNIAQKATGAAVGALGSLIGIPHVAQIGQSIIGEAENYSVKSTYAVSAPNSYKTIPGVKYADFRARKFPTKKSGGGGGLATKRIDGTAATQRSLFGGKFKSAITSGLYAATSISPAGPYSIFNRETIYGMGDHDNPYAIRNDFTAQSHVATQWRSKKWQPTKNVLSKITPFRGDKVNVIDFSTRELKNAYQWLPKPTFLGDAAIFDKVGLTKDFIKFYFTGPKLHAGSAADTTDDIIVFRALINSLTDSFSGNWSETTFIGRGDPNWQYTGYSRDLSLDFTVFATDRDEMKPIWRKLNALAGYTAPTYTKDNIALVGPWMRITIGDLFIQQAVIIKSISYSLKDAESSWEINIEDDPQMMQAPHKVDINLTLTPITDWLPQKGGRFYSLAKSFESDGTPTPGNDDWLSGFNDNKVIEFKEEIDTGETE